MRPLLKTTSTLTNPGKKRFRFVWRVINVKLFFVIKILFNTDGSRELIGTCGYAKVYWLSVYLKA